MDLNKLEDILKSKFDQEGTVTPDSERIWDQIAPEIAKNESKKRRFFIWLFFGLGLGVFAYLVEWPKAYEPVTNETQLVTNDISKEEQTSGADNDNTQQLDLKAIEKFNPPAETQALAPTNIQTDNTGLLDTSDSRKDLQQTTLTSKLEVKAQIADLTEVNKAGANEDSSKSDAGKIKSTSGLDQTYETFNKNLAKVESNLISDGSLNIADQIHRSTAKLSLIESLHPEPLLIAERYFSYTVSPNEYWVEPNSDKLAKVNSFGFSFGYGLNLKEMTLNPGQNQNVLSLRELNESAIEAYNFDLSYSRRLSNQFAVRTGFNFAFFVDKSVNSYHIVHGIQQEGVVAKITDKNGVETEITGSGIGILRRDSIITRYNYYRSVSVPIELVYNVPIKKFDFQLGMGASLNILNFNRGHIQNQLNKEYDINTDPENQFDTRWGLNLITNAGLAYKIYDSWSWFNGIELRYAVSPISSSTSAVKQKHHLLNIKTGLRYAF